MAALTFQKGSIVIYGESLYRFQRLIENNLWQIEEVTTGKYSSISVAEIKQLYLDRKLKFYTTELGSPIKSFSRSSLVTDEKNTCIIRRRHAFVKEILLLPASQKIVARQLKRFIEKNPDLKPLPSVRTVLRWKEQYLNNGEDIYSLSPRNAKKGNRNGRYTEEVRNIVEDVIEAKYMSLEKHTVQDVIDEVYARVKKNNNLQIGGTKIKAPGRRYIERLISEIPAFDKIAAREGHTIALHRFRSVKASRSTFEPLERAEIDHTRMDLFVIDDENLLPMGRPWLTVCIDVFSRSILGLYISFDPPSYMTVGHCLKHSFLPKRKNEMPGIDVNELWHQHGVMRELVVDNGLEFHSTSLENACYSLGIEIHYSPRKTPWFKGKVERYFKELNNGVLHKVPGTTFSNIFDKGDYDPVKHAVVRYSMLKGIVNKWVSDVYHQRPHSSLQASPSQVWNSGISDENIPLPDDPDFIDCVLGKSDERKLTHKGVEYDRLFYNSGELSDLRREYGESFYVDIRIDDSDIGELIVLNPKDRSIIRVPALRYDYAEGVSRWQHKIYRKYTKEAQLANDSDSWIMAKHEISNLIDSELAIGKRKPSARIARFRQNSNSKKTSVPSSKKSSDTGVKRTANPPRDKIPQFDVIENRPRKGFKPDE